MECSEIRAILYKNFEPSAPLDLDENVRAHIEGCPSCSRLLNNLQEQAESLRALPRIEAPSGFLGQVRSRIEKPSGFVMLRQKVSSFLGSRQFFQFAGVAATATLIVVTTQIMLKDESKQKSPIFLPSPPAETRSAPPAGSAFRPDDRMEKGFQAESVEPKIEQVPEKTPGSQVYSDLKKQGEQLSIVMKLKVHPPSTRGKEEKAHESMMPRALPAAPPGRREERKSASVRTPSVADPELQNAVSDVRRLILSLNGRILSSEEAQGSGVPAHRMLIAEIPQSKYAALTDKLRQIGNLDINKNDYPEGPPDSYVRVTIHFE
ncbi:MAG: hypothetical protein AB9866_25580 [Syntrophobacteraceae bacterium]